MQRTSLLHELVNLFFKYKWFITIVFFTTILTVTVASFLLPPTYEAKSSLLIKFGREYVYRPHLGDNKGPSNYFNREGIINTEIEILTSRDLLESVINQVGIETLYPELGETPPENMLPIEAALLKFEKNVSAQGNKNVNIIWVTFRHTDPEIAATTVNSLVELFKRKHLKIYSESDITEFLEEKVETYRGNLVGAEHGLEVFKQQNGAFSLDEQRSLLLRQYYDLNTVKKKTSNEIAELERKLESLQDQKTGMSKYTRLYSETGDVADKAKSQLLALQLKEEGLLSKYNKSHPLVIQVRKDIDLVSEFIKQTNEATHTRVRMGKNEVYLNLEKELINSNSDLKAKRVKEKALDAQSREVDQELQDTNVIEKQLNSLEREAAVLDRNYRTYRSKLEEARISNEMDRKNVTNIRIIQTATVPAKPIRPYKTLNILLSIIFGIFGSFSLALAREYSGQGLSTPSSVEQHLGLPVLATVPFKTKG